MNQEKLRELFACPEAPWAVVAPETLPSDELRRELAATSGLAWVSMDGSAMTRLGSLMLAFQDSFTIPDYFGHNWPALDETLCDLEWFPAEGYVAHVRNTHMVLRDDDLLELRIFYKTMERVAHEWSVPVNDGEYWDHGPIPFHWLLTCPKGERPGVTDMFRDTGTHAPWVIDP